MTELGPTTVTTGGQWGYGRIEGFPLDADISSPFGPRAPITLADGRVLTGSHAGIDLPAPKGMPVYHAGPEGTVKESGGSNTRGRYVLVEHDDGSGTRYVHLTEALQLAVGMRVRRGDIVGFVGTTGYSTGYHLHFEYIPNVDITGVADPLSLFRAVIEQADDVMSRDLSPIEVYTYLADAFSPAYDMSRDTQFRPTEKVTIGTRRYERWELLRQILE